MLTEDESEALLAKIEEVFETNQEAIEDCYGDEVDTWHIVIDEDEDEVDLILTFKYDVRDL